MKPLVFFKDDINNIIMVGTGAFIQPINHPSKLVSNTTWVFTSPVLKKWPCGGFDTWNTRYRKEGYTGRWSREMAEVNCIEDC